MHRSALSGACARGFAEQLRHHLVRLGALGDAVAMAAVRAQNIIVIPQITANTDSDRLLPAIHVQRSHYAA